MFILSLPDYHNIIVFSAPFTLLDNASLLESVYIETVDYEAECPVSGHPPPDNVTWILPDGNSSTLPGQVCSGKCNCSFHTLLIPAFE